MRGYSHRDRQRVERAADLSVARCYRDRTAARVSEFAEVLGVARPYLSRIIPAISGLSVRDFLRRRQLAYAAHLLRSTPASVQEIGIASAFGTASTFHRCFVAAFGKTPGEYRKQGADSDAPSAPVWSALSSRSTRRRR